MQFAYSLARHIKSRLHRIKFCHAYTYFQRYHGRMGVVMLRTDEGQFFQIDVHLLRHDETYRRPRNLDPVSNERTKIDALCIAERVSEQMETMLNLPQDKRERARRTPWLKNNIAAFALRANHGRRYCVEVWEVVDSAELKRLRKGYDAHFARDARSVSAPAI